MEWTGVCEQYRFEFLGQPASAVTSFAFVAASVGILAVRRHEGFYRDASAPQRQQLVFALLVAGIGVGSFVQHGPHPDWQAYAHDLPLAAVLVFVATDAASDLAGHELPAWWWLIPTGAMAAVVASGPTASTLVQSAMAAAAIGLSLLRARRRPELRRTLVAALGTVATGALIGTLTDRTLLCRAESLIQGHALWHVLAAAGLWRLTAAIGARERIQTLKRNEKRGFRLLAVIVGRDPPQPVGTSVDRDDFSVPNSAAQTQPRATPHDSRDPVVEIVLLLLCLRCVIGPARHERAAHLASKPARTFSAGIARDGSASRAS